MIPGKKYTPQDLLDMAWRRKWLVIIPAVVFTVGAAVYAQMQPNRYRADTLILVVPQRVPETYVRSTVTSRIEDRLQSISQQILSRTRLERIILDFSLYPELVKRGIMEDVVEQMRRDIDLQIVKGDAFRVVYRSDNARRAMQVAERLASLFIDENLKDREVLAQGTNQFLETQLQDARRRLVESEQKIELYRRQHAGELPTQLESNLQAMNGAQMQLQALADSVNRDRDRRLVLDRTASELEMQAKPAPEKEAPDVVATIEQPAVAAASHAQQLDAARRLLRDLELRLKPAHPDIARVKRVIADLERKSEADAEALAATPLAERRDRTAPPVENPAEAARRLKSVRDEIANVDRQIVAKEKEQERLKGAVSELQRRVDASPTRESEMVELMRDYSTLQTLYQGLLTKNEDAKISANLERRQIGEQFKVLDPARIPERPYSPDRQRIIMMGTLMGIMLGAALGAFLEYRDTSLKNDADVFASLSLPVLALVPVMQSAAERRRLRRRKVILSLGSAATMVAVGVVAFVVWKLRIGF